MEALKIPELTNEQIEELCLVAEKAARDHVHSKVPSGKIDTLAISAEAEGTKPMLVRVDVAVTLSPSMKNVDVQKLADGAVKAAFLSAEKHLRGLTCHSQT